MQPIGDINLCQLIADKDKSTTHLQTVNFQEFIKICQIHLGIVSTFGSCQGCKRACALCSSCQKHRGQDSSRHEYLDVGQLSKTLREIKSKYQQYHTICIQEMIPQFLANIRTVVLQFMQGLQQWGHETVLLTNFAGVGKHRRIHALLTDGVKDWQMGQLSCADLWELEALRDRVLGLSDGQMRDSIAADLGALFLKSLTHFGLLPQQQAHTQGTQNKREQVVQGTIEEIGRKIEQLQSRVKSAGEQPESILIWLTRISDQAMMAQQEKEQQNEKLGHMLEQIMEHIRQYSKVEMKFAVKECNDQFWEFLRDRLVELAGRTHGNQLQQVTICATHYAHLFQKFCEAAHKQFKENTVRSRDEPLWVKIKNTKFIFIQQLT